VLTRAAALAASNHEFNHTECRYSDSGTALGHGHYPAHVELDFGDDVMREFGDYRHWVRKALVKRQFALSKRIALALLHSRRSKAFACAPQR
jgi:hypothetical protein